MTKEIIKPGHLKKLSYDRRDLKVGRLFSLPMVPDLPDDYDVGPAIKIKDQKYTDFCSAFAGTAVSEDQEGVELDPLFQFMAIEKVKGNPDEFGADLRSAAMSFKDIGSSEQSLSTHTVDEPRATIIDPASWNPAQFANASKHKKQSFAFVTGSGDFFDNIRLALWNGSDKKQSVLTGVTWCREWAGAPGGVLEAVQTESGGHAIKIKGWKTVAKGEIYLVATLSNGSEFGDNGYFYISRAVANANEDYGAIVFLDEDPDTLKKHQELGVKIDSPLRPILYFIKWIMSLFKK